MDCDPSHERYHGQNSILLYVSKQIAIVFDWSRRTYVLNRAMQFGEIGCKVTFNGFYMNLNVFFTIKKSAFGVIY